jgi:hypothetical protein
MSGKLLMDNTAVFEEIAITAATSSVIINE